MYLSNMAAIFLGQIFVWQWNLLHSPAFPNQHCFHWLTPAGPQHNHPVNFNRVFGSIFNRVLGHISIVFLAVFSTTFWPCFQPHFGQVFNRVLAALPIAFWLHVQSCFWVRFCPCFRPPIDCASDQLLTALLTTPPPTTLLSTS